jgi:hypothetical protein
VRRFWERRWLAPAGLAPRLVRAALAQVPPGGGGQMVGLTHVVLDSVRCGPWDVVWRGRVVPVSWAVLAYPWP